MSVLLSPIGNDAPFVDGNGDPLNGGLLYTYTAGSSTPENTYTTNSGGTPNANPIVLDSNGYPSNGANVVEIWLTSGVNYKFALTSSGGTPIWTRDNVSGINDTSSSQDQWVSGPAPTYVSGTSFTLVGDQTDAFHVGRRLKTQNTAGTIYSTITASAFTTSTAVTVVNDSGNLDSGLSAVSYGLLSATNPSTPLLTDAYPIASGSSDKTKKVRVEVDGLTTATTRVLTVPNANVVLSFPKGYIFGLGMANNGSDATNDIDFSTGQATDSTGVIDLPAVTAMTKQLDAAWAAGTNAGGRMSAAAIANTTYHCYVIRKDSDGTCDFGFDTSATAPTMPSGYTYFRRIGSILRESAAIVSFSQVGDEFLRKTGILDVNANNPGTSAVSRTLSVPIGVQVRAIVNWALTNSGSGVAAAAYISSLDQTDEAVSQTAAPLFQGTGNAQAAAGGLSIGGQQIVTRTNTSAQVRSRLLASDASVTLRGATVGWFDRRGKDS